MKEDFIFHIRNTPAHSPWDGAGALALRRGRALAGCRPPARADRAFRCRVRPRNFQELGEKVRSVFWNADERGAGHHVACQAQNLPPYLGPVSSDRQFPVPCARGWPGQVSVRGMSCAFGALKVLPIPGSVMARAERVKSGMTRSTSATSDIRAVEATPSSAGNSPAPLYLCDHLPEREHIGMMAADYSVSGIVARVMPRSSPSCQSPTFS